MIDIKAFRTDLGVTQTELATAMGMPLRSYQDIEAGKNPVRPIHVAAARWASVKLVATGTAKGVLEIDVIEMIDNAFAKMGR